MKNKITSKKWSIQISIEAADKLKKFCKKHRYTMSGFVEECLEEGYLMEMIHPKLSKRVLDEMIKELDKQNE